MPPRSAAGPGPAGLPRPTKRRSAPGPSDRPERSSRAATRPPAPAHSDEPAGRLARGPGRSRADRRDSAYGRSLVRTPEPRHRAGRRAPATGPGNSRASRRRVVPPRPSARPRPRRRRGLAATRRARESARRCRHSVPRPLGPDRSSGTNRASHARRGSRKPDRGPSLAWGVFSTTERNRFITARSRSSFGESACCDREPATRTRGGEEETEERDRRGMAGPSFEVTGGRGVRESWPTGDPARGGGRGMKNNRHGKSRSIVHFLRQMSFCGLRVMGWRCSVNASALREGFGGKAPPGGF